MNEAKHGAGTLRRSNRGLRGRPWTCAALAIATLACGCTAESGDGSPTGTAATGPTATGYPPGAIAVVNGDSVRLFPPDAGADEEPLARLPLGGDGRGVGFDHDRNLYVILHGDDGHRIQIEVYASGSVGGDPPTRVIKGPNTQLDYGSPAGVAIDPSGHLYVANGDVLVFAPDAHGDVPPVCRFGTATIDGWAWDATGITIEEGGRLVVAGLFSPLAVFPLDADGLVDPVATFGGSDAGPAVAVGPSGEIVVASIVPPAVTVFSSEGAPLQRIAGPKTEFENDGVHGIPVGLAVEPSGRRLVATLTRVVAFAPGANGNVAPIATFARGSALQVAVAP